MASDGRVSQTAILRTGLDARKIEHTDTGRLTMWKADGTRWKAMEAVNGMLQLYAYPIDAVGALKAAANVADVICTEHVDRVSYTCSRCLHGVEVNHTYCPNCGAKIRWQA